MMRTVGVGLAILGGAALIEAALIPGLVIGGAAVLAPQLFPQLRRRPAGPARKAAPDGAAASAEAGRAKPSLAMPSLSSDRLGVKQAVVKTITYRVIVTTLDFTSNYVVIGEFATAAGLSAFQLVAAPLYYLAHETVWNYFNPGVGPVEVRLRRRQQIDTDGESNEQRGFTLSRAIAKTITFRSIATVTDFTVTFVVVGDLAIAAGLTAFGAVLGPFVYYGHEKLWERINAWQQQQPAGEAPMKLLPAPTI